MFYYFENERKILFENYSGSNVDDLNRLPVLFKFNKIGRNDHETDGMQDRAI